MTQIVLFSGLDDTENERLAELLSPLISKGVRVSAVAESQILAGAMTLPFIETDDGDRYFGVSSIERFIKGLSNGYTGKG